MNAASRGVALAFSSTALRMAAYAGVSSVGSIAALMFGSEHQRLAPVRHRERRIEPGRLAERAAGFRVVERVRQVQALVDEELRLLVLRRDRECVRPEILQPRRDLSVLVGLIRSGRGVVRVRTRAPLTACRRILLSCCIHQPVETDATTARHQIPRPVMACSFAKVETPDSISPFSASVPGFAVRFTRDFDGSPGRSRRGAWPGFRGASSALAGASCWCRCSMAGLGRFAKPPGSAWSASSAPPARPSWRRPAAGCSNARLAILLLIFSVSGATVGAKALTSCLRRHLQAHLWCDGGGDRRA